MKQRQFRAERRISTGTFSRFQKPQPGKPKMQKTFLSILYFLRTVHAHFSGFKSLNQENLKCKKKRPSYFYCTDLIQSIM